MAGCQGLALGFLATKAGTLRNVCWWNTHLLGKPLSWKLKERKMVVLPCSFHKDHSRTELRTCRFSAQRDGDVKADSGWKGLGEGWVCRGSHRRQMQPRWCPLPLSSVWLPAEPARSAHGHLGKRTWLAFQLQADDHSCFKSHHTHEYPQNDPP